MHIGVRFSLIIMLFSLLLPVFAQGEDALDVQLVTQPTVENEIVSFEIRVQRADSTTPGNLTAANVTLSEAAEDLRVTPIANRPLGLAWVINLSNGSELSLIQDTLRAYFDDYYQPEDRLIFYILDEQSSISSPRVETPTSRLEIEQVIQSLDVGTGFYSVANAFTESIAWLRLVAASNPEISRQAVYIGPFLNRVSEAETALAFQEAQTLLHVIQAHATHELSTPTMRALAANGGGLFVNNRENSFVVTGAAMGELKTLYDTIAQNRLTYQVSYRPVGASNALERDATVSIVTPNGEQGRVQIAYEWAAVPPAVQILAPPSELELPYLPSGNNIQRNRNVRELGVIVQVSFPDGATRDLESLRVEVRDLNTQNILFTRLRPNPSPNAQGNYEIPVRLDSYTVPGSFALLQFSVQVKDVLGYTSNAVREVNITVERPTPVPTVTTSAQMLVLTPGNTIEGMSLPGTQRSDLSEGDVQTLLLSAVAALGLLVIYLILLLRRQRRNRVIEQVFLPAAQAPVAAEAPPREAAPEVATSEQKPEDQPGEAQLYGRLLVINGSLGIGEIQINRREFTIGRSTEYGVHYPIDHPYINKRHCTFVNRNGRFMIRDLGGKNGTFVDGERLNPNQEVAVPFGSEIGITKNITLQLYEPDADLTLYTSVDTDGGYDNSTDHGLRFRPFLQVNYPEDENSPPTRYNPIKSSNNR